MPTYVRAFTDIHPDRQTDRQAGRQTYRQTGIRTYGHTYIRTHIQTRTYIHTCMHTYIHTCLHTYIHTHTHIHAFTHTRIHAHTHIHTYTHTRVHAYTQTHRHTYTHIHAYTQTQTYLHTYIRILIYTIHTYILPWFPIISTLAPEIEWSSAYAQHSQTTRDSQIQPTFLGWHRFIWLGKLTTTMLTNHHEPANTSINYQGCTSKKWEWKNDGLVVPELSFKPNCELWPAI